jgi:hypothetical protein
LYSREELSVLLIYIQHIHNDVQQLAEPYAAADCTKSTGVGAP